MYTCLHNKIYKHTYLQTQVCLCTQTNAHCWVITSRLGCATLLQIPGEMHVKACYKTHKHETNIFIISCRHTHTESYMVVYTHMLKHLHAHTHTHTQMHSHPHMKQTYSCRHTHTESYMIVNTHMFKHLHTQIHTHMYSHTHTHYSQLHCQWWQGWVFPQAEHS